MNTASKTTAESLRSGKSGKDENFPVASLLIAAPLRPVIFAFYDFVRSGDDVADHPTLPPNQKRALLDQLDQSLLGESDEEPLGVALRGKLAERGLTNQHARDLLDAFRQDVDKNRYASWDELIGYCRLSAMPVGRFMLDVHGESEKLWPVSDAICAALQINNHLQDCQKDYLALDRVYVPGDALLAAGADVADLRAQKASPHLRACLRDLAVKNRDLLEQGASLPGRHQGFPPRPGNRRHRPPCAQDRRPPGCARSPERMCEAEQVANAVRRRARCGRRRAASCPREGGMTDQETAEEARQRARKSSFYRAMAILPREKRDAMFEIYSFCRAVDDIADEGGDSRRNARGSTPGARDIDALYAGEPPALAAGLAEPLRRFGFGARISSPSSTAWRWTSTPTLSRPTPRRSTSIATASPARRAAVGARVRPARAGGRGAGPPSRPRAATDQYPARHRRGCGHRPSLSAARKFHAAGIADPTPEKIVALPDLGAVCAPLLAKAQRRISRGRRHHGHQPRENIKAPKIMSLAYARHLAPALRMGLCGSARKDQDAETGAARRHPPLRDFLWCACACDWRRSGGAFGGGGAVRGR